jgi:flagellar hook-associated protein 3 FlgL
MQTRITEGTISHRMLAGLQSNLSKMTKLEGQLSSGKAISRPSDSPTGTVSAMRLRTDMRTVQQYSRNIDNGLGWLSTADQTLTSSLDQLNRARDLVVQGASTGAAGADSRAAIATELTQIRDSLIELSNTKFLDRPIFGGTTTGTVAFDASGSFVGDAGKIERRVGENASVQVNLTGSDVYGSGPKQIFAVLTKLAADLTATPPGNLDQGLKDLDAGMSTIMSQLADVGARYNRMTVMQDTGNERLVTLKSQLSDFEDIDLPNTIMEVQIQQTAYQGALAATAKVVQTSLIDFLR